MAAHTSKAAKKRRPNRMSNLFFVRRRPRFNMSDEWEPPESDADYEKLIDEEGFVSITSLAKQTDPASHPIIVQDISDLKEHLLRTFFELDHKAKYYQNTYYLYQWVFVWGAFFTTLLGTLAAFTASTETGLTRLFSILTAIVGAITAYFNALSNRSRPSERWAKTRTLAEELRGQYFKYLARIAPYDTPERVQILRENVMQVRVKEQENQGGAS